MPGGWLQQHSSSTAAADDDDDVASNTERVAVRRVALPPLLLALVRASVAVGRAGQVPYCCRALSLSLKNLGRGIGFANVTLTKL